MQFVKPVFSFSHISISRRPSGGVLASFSIEFPVSMDEMVGGCFGMCSAGGTMSPCSLQDVSVSAHHVMYPFQSLNMIQYASYHVLLDLLICVAPFDVFNCVVECRFCLRLRSVICNGRLFSVLWTMSGLEASWQSKLCLVCRLRQ